jgi:hypothetical protein
VDKRDRWFYAVSLLMGVLPFSMMALALHFLPDEVPLIVELYKGDGIMYMHKNRNLVIGVFCLIPIAAVMLAGELKRRKLIERNFYAITLGATVISLAFLCFVLYQLIMQSQRVNIISSFDFVGVISVCVSFIIAMFGVPIYDLQPNAVLGFRNSYTMRSDAVWSAVHHHAAFACIAGFTVLGMGLSFIRGLPALLTLLCGMAVYLFYVLFISWYYFKKLIVKK